MHSKNICAMDAFLAQNGYCRKMLVKDGSCIFRAVSENLFLTQAYHLHVRQMSTDYMWRHRQEFQDFDLSCKHRDLAGVVEMFALSKVYQLEFLVFHQPGIAAINVTQSGHSNQVCLVLAEGGHYDLVHSRSVVQDLALCQSVIYEVLYRGVFGLSSELEEAVSFIRQQKKSADTNGKIFPFSESLQKLCEKESVCVTVAERPTPPLPYRIAKALDPVLYRNVALDIVQEEKREIKLRLQGRGLYGVFCPGDKCQVQLEEDSATLYNAHVQEINEPNGPVIVFIEELGEKKSVSYSCLRPLPLNTAKPGCDSKRFPVAELGSVLFSDRRGRRRKNTMPGAPEFQVPTSAARCSRSTVAARRAGSEVSPGGVATAGPAPTGGGGEGVCDTMDGGGYCLVSAGQSALAPVSGAGGGQGVVYWMPVVTVPYASSMGQVNLAWAPSQDPYGKDLPINDMNTMRYFFNLGVEYFRISANMQQQQQQQQQPQPQQNYLTSSPLPPLISSGPPGSSVVYSIDQGGSFVTPAPPPDVRQGKAHGAHTQGKTPAPARPAKGQGQGRVGGVPEGVGGRGESMEMSSDVSDCVSDAGPADGDEVDDGQMELASNRTDDDAGSTHGGGGGEEAGSDKGSAKGGGRGKRKYYMYGPHKLIKPIKDIPPRFQIMLAENSAAKARCEGQPIYMQLSHADLLALEAADANSALNADAQCFYPSQGLEHVMVDDVGMAAAFAHPAPHPPPILVPPPPVMGPPSGGVVYSSVASSASALPPPAYSVAVSGEGKIPVITSVVPAGKGQAHCGPGEEFARPSSAKAAPHSPRVSSVASSSLSAPPPPFPPSPSMPPPPPSAAPPLHAPGMVAASAPACSVSGGGGGGGSGGGKQCFYVYPSPSTGYPPAVSAAPAPQPGGQMVYVMPPQGYPAPPCTAYQPMMAPPTHAMGLPCAPVAVQ